MRQKILPSVMAKNQQELDAYFKRLKGVTKEIHLDISDGKFVKSNVLNFRFKLSKVFNYNAHLMIKNPLKWIENNFKKIDLFIPQIEEIKNPAKYIAWMKAKNRKVAFALKPETMISSIKPYLKDIDYVLVLTVHPGFYGAKFLRTPLKKIKKIKEINPKVKVVVDGGMHPTTISLAAKFGADYFVSGSYISKSDHPRRQMKKLLKAME